MSGVKVQGIECPIIREGDNIVDIVVDSVLKEVRDEIYTAVWRQYNINDKDIIGITESVVARAAGQYITVDDIAADIEKKFGKDATICLINPIYSRNRFSLILKGIARAAAKVWITMPLYDEVGNPRGVNRFTGVNIEEYYKELCESENCECEIIYDTNKIWPKNIIYCGLHDYINPAWHRTATTFALNNICSDKSPDWGVLGTNKATEERLKLFPSKAECQRVCEAVKAKTKERTGKDVIVCVYGDGCFKDPVGGIWEFADPITMPGYTDKELLESTPNEYKLKYLIDTGLPEEQIMAFTNNVSAVDYTPNRMGTTPRLYRDLLASLMDLTSGSGDRATPVVLIQNYFK